MFFPTWKKIQETYGKYKAMFFSDRPGDKKRSWWAAGVLLASVIALFQSLGHWWTELVILFLLVETFIFSADNNQ